MMRSIDSLRKRVNELVGANKQPACRCIVEYYRGESEPPELELCDRCGLPRRCEHTVVEVVVVHNREEAVAALAEVSETVPPPHCGA
jgi:hypothetical protein